MTKKPVTSWSERLKALRVRLDLTQAQMAERFGVPTRTWISWENAQRVPSRSSQRLLVLTFPELS
jgi:DNA-binding transcriptional regulator YiaG